MHRLHRACTTCHALPLLCLCCRGPAPHSTLTDILLITNLQPHIHHPLPQASRAAFLNKVQQCFAVRAEVDSLLDVSRATFCRLTEGVHELADSCREQTGAAVKVGCSRAVSSCGCLMVRQADIWMEGLA
jgi:hypothetical protein